MEHPTIQLILHGHDYLNYFFFFLPEKTLGVTGASWLEPDTVVISPLNGKITTNVPYVLIVVEGSRSGADFVVTVDQQLDQIFSTDGEMMNFHDIMQSDGGKSDVSVAISSDVDVDNGEVVTVGREIEMTEL